MNLILAYLGLCQLNSTVKYYATTKSRRPYRELDWFPVSFASFFTGEWGREPV